MNVCFTSASGNQGKTTIAINLIIALMNEYKEEQFKIVDCDERMKSLYGIMAKRKANKLSFLEVFYKVDDISIALESKNTLNIFDLKGHLGEKEATIINNCDLVIVVSGNEILELEKTIQYSNDLTKANINHKILLNKYDKNEGLDYEEIKGIFKNKLMENYLKNKSSFKKYSEKGEVVYDKILSKVFGLSNTKKEFDLLKDEILNILKLK